MNHTQHDENGMFLYLSKRRLSKDGKSLNTQAEKKIVIVGGGIAGLSTAYYLRRAMQEQGIIGSVIGIEASDRLGGMVHTEHSLGCVIEHGPDCFSTERPNLLQLCRDLGLSSELIETKLHAQGLGLREGERLYSLPASFCGLTSIDLVTLVRLPCLSLKGKLRMACEALVPRRTAKEPESLGDFVARRFGEEVLQRLAQPFLGSIFGLDLRQISLSASFPHWAMLENKHGSLTRAFWAAKRNPSAVISMGFRSLRGGLSVLTEELRSQTDVEWQTGVQAQSLHRSRNGQWQLCCDGGQIITADVVCLAVPAKQAAFFLKQTEEDLAAKLTAQPVRSVVLVNAIFRREDWPSSLKGSGFISGLDQTYDAQGGTFSSFKFESRSPDNLVLARLFGSSMKADLFEKQTDNEVQAAIVKDFCRVAGIKAAPVWLKVSRYPKILPSYDMRYLTWKKDVETLAGATADLYLVGQSYQPGGLSGCVLGAQKTAEKIIKKWCDSESNFDESREMEMAYASD